VKWSIEFIALVFSYLLSVSVWAQPEQRVNVGLFSQNDTSGWEIRDIAEATWFSERRNLVVDINRLHGRDIQQIDGVAIMTDSDNSGLNATALYGDIFFSSAGQ
jgi:hypothetical protein